MGKHSAGGGGPSRDSDISSTLGGGRSGQGRRRRGDVAVPVAVPPRSPSPGARYDGGYVVGDHPDSRPHPEHREHAAWGAPEDWAAESGRGRSAGYRPDELPDPYDTGQWQTFDEPVLPAPDPYDTGQWQTARPGHPVRRPQEAKDPHDTGQWQTFDEPVLPPRSFEAPSGRRIPRPRAEQEAFPGQEPGMDSEIPAAPAADTGRKNGGKGRTLTGITAAAVVTVLAVIVTGQVGGGRSARSEAGSADSAKRGGDDSASRSKERPTPGVAKADAPAVAVGYDQLMAQQYPIDPKLALGGQFETMPGHDAAPGRGKVLRFRVDVEKGLPLDGALFSQTVFKTLNDERSWAHGGARTFERVSSGPADIVVTLASPGTTAKWCAKSGLDITVDNVSCDAASTERTMINAFRWAQGAETFGAGRMHEYRQMLINHEVGHRLGHGHTGCPKAGELAPVMMQQTKFLSLDGGPTCKPNAWPFP